jgi:DNA (cytosine-5)-methyltransferase 1
VLSERLGFVKLLSLCTGYGGLDMAVEAYFDAELIGCSDINKASALAIDKHFKVPNYGDLRNLIGTDLQFDILTAGYPCQPFSHAGQRKGTQDERHIWPFIAQIISHSRPRIVVLENVRGHLSLGFKEVLQDLAKLGYDARWTVVRASDVGAPHQRARLFILATSDTNGFGFSLVEHQSRAQGNQGQIQSESQYLGQSSITDTNGTTCDQSRRANRGLHGATSEVINGSNRDEYRCCGETCCNTHDQHQPHNGQMPGLGRRFASRCEMSMQTAPDPLVDGKLNPKFVEYMMGLPEGWVTDLPISRNQQLMMLGNGVVPQQAFYALELLCKIRHAV